MSIKLAGGYGEGRDDYFRRQTEAAELHRQVYGPDALVQYDQSGTAVNPELQDLYQFANPGTERTDTDQTYRVQDNIADEFGADTQAAATEVTQAASSETSENFGRGYTVHSAGQYATEFAFGGRRRRVIKPTGAIVLQKLNYRIHPGGLSTQNTVRTSLN